MNNKVGNGITAADGIGLRTVRRRGVDAVIWSMPAVNFELMVAALRKVGGDFNQVVYWSRLPDWKNQTLTPNPDVIYLMPFYDTRQGPVVLEIPAAEGAWTITGSIDDGWQTALEDVGPAGLDQGKGGRYLILPPGYQDVIPEGFLPLHSSTCTGYALLRSNIGKGSEAEIAAAAEYGRRIRIHPLAQDPQSPDTRFTDAWGSEFCATIPYDARYFQALHSFIQREPWIERDRAMIDPLRSLGIEKGKPFKPSAEVEAALGQAAEEARTWLDNQYEQGFPPYFEGGQWALPAAPEVVEALGSNFAKTDAYPTDARGMVYSFAFFSAKHLGQGQFYLMTTRDKDGAPLDGGKTYRLHVPAKAPVKLYWSATAYDRATHALIRGQSRASRASSSQGLTQNSDGSVDVYFGPKAPAGQDANWVPTRADGQFEVLFRFYGPDKPLFDKIWVLGDIEEMP